MCLRLREALVQWKEYARVLEVLELETETHLLDQVKLFAPPLPGSAMSKGMLCRLELSPCVPLHLVYATLPAPF